jgi:L-threonylcarbamoyladenylate synthase
MLESHYAPRVPLFLGAISELMKHHAGKRIGVLTFTHDWQCGGDVCHVEVLSGAGDVPEAATALFAALRRLDSSGIDCILAEPVPDVGIGRAVNDRLRRAAVG